MSVSTLTGELIVHRGPSFYRVEDRRWAWRAPTAALRLVRNRPQFLAGLKCQNDRSPPLVSRVGSVAGPDGANGQEERDVDPEETGSCTLLCKEPIRELDTSRDRCLMRWLLHLKHP